MKVKKSSADYTTTLIGHQEWPEVAIEEIADVNPRVDKSSVPDDLPVSFVPMPSVGAGDGSIRVEETRPAGAVKKGFTAFLEGDVLFAKITPCMENGKMAVVPELVNGYGFGSTEFHVLRPKAGMDAKYLYYYVSSRTFRSEAERHMTGAVGQRRVPTSYLKACKIPVAPLDQQKRIVAEIEKQFSRLDEAVANLKRVKANLKRYKAAVLKAAVEGRLTEEWRKAHPEVEPASKLLDRILAARRAKWEEAELAKMETKGKAPRDHKWKAKYKEPLAPAHEDASDLPKGWAWSRTDQLFWFVTSGSRGWAKYYTNTGSAFLRVGNLDHDSIELDLQDLQHVEPPEGAEGIRTKVTLGDVLISITADVGMIAVVQEGLGDAYINQHISLARPVSVPGCEYVAWYLAARPGQKQFQDLQRGATKAGLGLEDIKGVDVPLPPLEEQHQIIQEIERRLSLVDELDLQVDANIQRATRLRQSLLTKTFGGGLAPKCKQ